MIKGKWKRKLKVSTRSYMLGNPHLSVKNILRFSGKKEVKKFNEHEYAVLENDISKEDVRISYLKCRDWV